MDNFSALIKQQLQKKNKKRIVFPEYIDERVLRAANRLSFEHIITPIFIGNNEKVQQYAKKFNIKLAHYEVIDPLTFEQKDELIDTYIQRRYDKVDISIANEKIKDANLFATLLVYLNYADGLVSGAIHTTSSAVRPALQIIKTKKDVKKVSGAYIMVRENEKYIFADCAINISPSSEDLAEIALLSAETAELLQIEPKVALLSFSTKGSAKSKETDKIIAALHLAKNKNPSLIIDGEIQFDAAYLPSLAMKKAPQSAIKGDANVFIFPNLESGNISCKITERLGGFQAVGPILQGLNRPVNLLSRGCSEDDIYKVGLITALQANVSNDL